MIPIQGTFKVHCNILRFVISQIAGFNGLSDALKRLDFLSAVHDCRRFNYIVRLLDLLVSHRMGGLSGCAQRVLFNMLEEVALEGDYSHFNLCYTFHKFTVRANEDFQIALSLTVYASCFKAYIASKSAFVKRRNSIDVYYYCTVFNSYCYLVLMENHVSRAHLIIIEY